ncbi:MAG: S-layer homology domain-containing protein [Clostridiales Family XIII bacterium]|jgi:hypothetical protein|nr:S-layer homology domain-containing protein [Clostridiales Family XIII bacterium]
MSKTIGRRAVAIICCIALIGSGLFTQSVFAEHWADPQMQRYQALGVISGYPDGSIGEDNPVTRAEAAKIFSELLARRELPAAANFSDVPASHWAWRYVQNVNALGLMNGTSDSTFEPEARITREQAATVLNRVFAKFMTGAAATDFSDSSVVASWASAAVAALSGNGYITGYPDGSFKPQANITKAELITIIDKIVPDVIVSASDVKEAYTGNVLVLAGDIDLSETEIAGNVAVAGAAVANPPKLSESFKGVVTTVEQIITGTTGSETEPAQTTGEGEQTTTTGSSGASQGSGIPSSSPSVSFNASTGLYSVDGVNYLLLSATGSYTACDYSIDGSAVTPTPVLTDNNKTTLFKLAVPAGTTDGKLLVKQGVRTIINNASFSFAAAGTAAPETLYGTAPMDFSELYYDVTANKANPGSVSDKPAVTSFDRAGTVTAPTLFIAEGTRTGGAGGTAYPTYINGDDDLAKVDVISSATYGDSVHFAPSQSMELNYDDPTTQGAEHAIVGVQKVETAVNFDLYANAVILQAAGRGTAQTAAVVAKMANFETEYTEFADKTIKDAAGNASALGVYKVKYLLNDGNWGKRVTANAAAAKDLLYPIADPTVSYGVTWGDKVISFNFVAKPDGTPVDSDALWSEYFDYIYGGYVEDSEGNIEPLVFLQNLFTHLHHTNVEAAISPSRFSRLKDLKSPDNYKVTIFAYGFEDIEFSNIPVADYGNSEAVIEQGASFDIKLGDTSTYFEDKHLHITGLGAEYLEAYNPEDGKIFKGSVALDPALYTISKSEGEIEVSFKDAFFVEGLQGSYSIKLQEDTEGLVSKAIAFTVNSLIARPTLLLPGAAAGVAADAEATAAEAVQGSGLIAIQNEAFAKALTLSGRGSFGQIRDITAGTGAEALGDAVVRADANSPYAINLSSSKFVEGHTYEISLISANFKWQPATGAAATSFVYYVKINAAPLEISFNTASDTYSAGGVNYLLLGVNGTYTDGVYSIDGSAVTPTPVLTENGNVTLIKLAVPAGAAAGKLLVKQDAETIVDETAFTFTAAGKDAPKTLYGVAPMNFSEFYHDVTANKANPGSVPTQPAAVSFDTAGIVTAPTLFIAEGTRTGGAGGTTYPTYINGDDDLAKVDVVSSATYGDSVHFAPSQSMELNYDDPTTQGAEHAIIGVQKVQAAVDFDLCANAAILEAAGKGTAQTAAVVAKMANFETEYTEFADGTIKDADGNTSALGVYKVKYLLNDGNWGKRVTANADAAKDLLYPIADPAVSYGVTWGDKVISFNFIAEPDGPALNSDALWEDYFDYIYGGYVEDSEGNVEPLVFLQNLFTHLHHTNVEVAISPSRFSRLNDLKSPDNYKVTILAYGFEDLEFASIPVADYGNSEAVIEQGASFDIKLGDTSTYFENKHLHISGLNAEYLTNYDTTEGRLLKGSVAVDPALYTISKLEGELEVTFDDAFFAEGLQGSYSIKLQEDTGDLVSKALAFTVNSIIDRPTLLLAGETAGVAADTVATAAEAAKDGGTITIQNEAFAKALTLSGRGSFSQIKDTAGTDAEALGDAVDRADANSPYAINLSSSKFVEGHTYEISLISANFKWQPETGAAATSFVYYVKITGAK